MGLYDFLTAKQKTSPLDPAMAAMYGMDPAQPPPQAGAPAQQAPVAQAPAPAAAPSMTSIAAPASSPTPFALPKPPAPMQSVTPPSFDDWRNSPEGKAVDAGYTPYEPLGKWGKLAQGLAFGVAETGGALNGHSGVGARLLEQSNEMTRSGLQRNMAHAGMIRDAYNQSVGQAERKQSMGYQAHEGALQDYNANLQGTILNRDQQAKAAEIVRSGLGMKGKMQDEDIVKQILRDSSAQGLPQSEDYVRRVVTSAPIVGPKYSLVTGEGGRPEAVRDTYGKTYTPDGKGGLVGPDGKPLSDAEALSVYNAGMQGHEARRQETIKDQERVAGFAADRQAQAFANQQQAANTQQVRERFGTALDADERLSRMEGSYQKAVKGDQQAMLALLTDHLGMTMGIQKGARITKDILAEAQTSQPWLEQIGAKFDKRGYLSGATLGPEQMKQMLDLGYEARNRTWSSAGDSAKMFNVAPPAGAQEIYSKRDPNFRVYGPAQGAAAATPKKGDVKTVNGVSYEFDGKQYVKQQTGYGSPN